MANPSSSHSATEPQRAERKSLFRSLAIYTVLIALLYFALRNAPFAEIWNALVNLKLWQIGLILLINAFVIVCMTARWWIIVRAENPSVPFLTLIGYRLSVFAVSYFTFGPQVGGEPLQIIYLQRRHGLTFARATSAVIMDKLLEFLVNFVLIGVGAWAIVRVGLFSENGSRLTLSLIGLGMLLSLPLVYTVLLYNGIRPLAKILNRHSFIHKKSKATRLVVVAEQMASIFCRKHARAMFLAIFVSFGAIAGIALEYFLMVSFLGMNINIVQISPR